ncbi:Armadillo repeat-containing protein 4, partial [Cichlidogyrus casuarinus]
MYFRKKDSDLIPADSDDDHGFESEDELELLDLRRQDPGADLPAEYWQIGKLIKFIKSGNQTSTIISLCALRDMALDQEVCQMAVREVGGLEVLINLLETEEVRCKVGALQVLKTISAHAQVRQSLADLGGLEPMVQLLSSSNREVQCLSAETIANIAKFSRARNFVLHHRGIKKLVTMLDAPFSSTKKSGAKFSSYENVPDLEVARCGALALWSLSRSQSVKNEMRRCGAINLLGSLLQTSSNENMLIAVMGTLQECASDGLGYDWAFGEKLEESKQHHQDP